MKFYIDKRTSRLVVCLIAIVALLLGVVLLLHVWEKGQTVVVDPEPDEDDRELLQYKGRWYTPRTDLETVLLMGIDKTAVDDTIGVQGEYEQSDLMMLLIIDKKAEKCSAIHINRDTMTEYHQISDSGKVLATVEGQITLAHSFGIDGHMRCRNAVWSVSNLLYGIKVDHYISITMDGVVVLNDLVGGVTLEVMDDFTGIDDTLVKGQTVTLHGLQALTYVRSRHDMEDPTNEHRMERQRQYLEALQAQMLRTADQPGTSTLNILGALNDYLVSDCSATQLSALSDVLNAWTISEYKTLEGETDHSGTFAEFRPDEAALQGLVVEQFYEEVVMHDPLG